MTYWNYVFASSFCETMFSKTIFAKHTIKFWQKCETKFFQANSNSVPVVTGRVFAIGTLAVCYIYSSEIFPTVVRNVGLGTSSVWARVGPMVSFRIRNRIRVNPCHVEDPNPHKTVGSGSS